MMAHDNLNAMFRTFYNNVSVHNECQPNDTYDEVDLHIPPLYTTL